MNELNYFYFLQWVKETKVTGIIVSQFSWTSYKKAKSNTYPSKRRIIFLLGKKMLQEIERKLTSTISKIIVIRHPF